MAALDGCRHAHFTRLSHELVRENIHAAAAVRLAQLGQGRPDLRLAPRNGCRRALLTHRVLRGVPTRRCLGARAIGVALALCGGSGGRIEIDVVADAVQHQLYAQLQAVRAQGLRAQHAQCRLCRRQPVLGAGERFFQRCDAQFNAAHAAAPAALAWPVRKSFLCMGGRGRPMAAMT